MTAQQIIEKLNLTKHPEGGLYKETYRSNSQITLENGKRRATGTAIYYLLQDKNKSHFHKVSSDELWFFHYGEPLEISVINERGSIEKKLLGNNLLLNEAPQVLVEANNWFAASIKSETGFALVSCVVAPGFDFDDFEMANKSELLMRFPHLQSEIERLSL